MLYYSEKCQTPAWCDRILCYIIVRSVRHRPGVIGYYYVLYYSEKCRTPAWCDRILCYIIVRSVGHRPGVIGYYVIL